MPLLWFTCVERVFCQIQAFPKWSTHRGRHNTMLARDIIQLPKLQYNESPFRRDLSLVAKACTEAELSSTAAHLGAKKLHP